MIRRATPADAAAVAATVPERLDALRALTLARGLRDHAALYGADQRYARARLAG